MNARFASQDQQEGHPSMGQSDADFILECLKYYPSHEVASALRERFGEAGGDPDGVSGGAVAAKPPPSVDDVVHLRRAAGSTTTFPIASLAERQLLAHLMNYRFCDLPAKEEPEDLEARSFWSPEEVSPDVTIRDMVLAAAGDESPVIAKLASSRLRSIGMVVSDRCLLVSTSHPGIAHMLRGTAWAEQWSSLLRRLPGAAGHRTVAFSSTCRTKTTAIPLTLVQRRER